MGDSMDDLDYILPPNCPSPYFDTWDRHNSIAFSATKGLRNAPGENNCFVNCAVQVFWHLDVFRRSYRRLLGHTCMGNSCIFCALKVIFTQFQYSDQTSLHPDALRKALAETFANQQRFQLGHMDDAAECFENILRRIHFHIACNHNEDACTAPHCLPHQKFSMVIHEKVVCPCGASSSPLKFGEMVHYVSASALVAQSHRMQENGDTLHPDRFGLLLRKASAVGDVRDCPMNCGKRVQKQRTLLNIPDVVSVGLVWDSDHPSMETTTEVASAIGTAIHLQDMFHRVMPDVRKLPRLQLVAVVCYYGKHYSTFVFHSKLKTWIYFDDATVREIGPQWENVVEKCSRGRFQPLLLLYANPSAAPVSVETAPRKRVMAPGFTPVGLPNNCESGLNLTHESIKTVTSSARCPTVPNHDQQAFYNNGHVSHMVHHAPDLSSSDCSGRNSPARLSREHARQPSFLFAVTGKVDKTKLGDGSECGNYLVGGAPHHSSRRQLLDGGASVEGVENYADYTLSSGDQYRRPTLNGADSGNLPLPPNLARYPDVPRKDSFTKRLVGVDIVRYQIDPTRVANYSPDYALQQSQGDGSFTQKGEKAGHSMAPVQYGHQRSLSSGREEDSMELSSGSQHVVVKPKPTAHISSDTVDGLSHSPVQSGLATLPRHKSPAGEKTTNQRQDSAHQEVAQLTHKSNLKCKTVDPPLPPGTPPPEYNAVLNSNQGHSRQTSVSSQVSILKGSLSMGNIDQVASGKKSDGDKVKKKVKKDKKSEKDISKKTEKRKTKSDSTLKKSESESDLLADKSSRYIDPRMVETILKHQGVHRQNSSCSNNSISSTESDSLMGKLLANKTAANSNLTVDLSYDNMSIGSQKDSGYGSSDRNSSSSTGSGTVDPYTQYFLSKSMVVPLSVNTQHLLEQNHTHHSKSRGPPVELHMNQSTTYSNGHRDEGRKVMHPIKESSQEDMMKVSPSEPIGTQKYILANVAVKQTDARPPPVPPKNFAQFQIIKSSQSTHERESSLDSLDKDENISSNFVDLCKKADSLMDSCMLAETQDDISSALRYCDSALGCLKDAMVQKDLTSKALAYVQKKHNSCLLKLRTLKKRMPSSRQESHSSGIGSDTASSVGNRSSITSSGSDISDQVGKQLHVDSKPGVQQLRHYTSQDSISSSCDYERPNNVLRQGTNNSRQEQPMETRNNVINRAQRASPMPCDESLNHQRQDSGTSYIPQSNSSYHINSNNSSGAESAGSSADLYGTLPRNKSRKPTCDNPASAEMYQSFLNKQKCLQAGVTSSQQSLDSFKSDSGSDHSSSASSQQKMNKSEIRHMLKERFVHRQQPSPVLQYNPQQSTPVQPHLQQVMPQNNSRQSTAVQPHLQQATVVQQWQEQQVQQDFRSGSQKPPVMPQRPGQNNGQIVQHSSRPQQQQQLPAQHSKQHVVHPPKHNSASYNQQNAQNQEQRQLPQTGFKNPVQTPGHNSHPMHKVQAHSVRPVPSQKPMFHTSDAAKARARPNQAPAFAPQQNSSEVGRHLAPQNVRVMPDSNMTGTNQSGIGGNYLVMMPPPPSQQLPTPSPLGGQIRQSASCLQLCNLPSSSSVSQLDCQKLVDSAYPANLSDQGTSFYNGGRSKLNSSPLPPALANEQQQGAKGSTDPQTATAPLTSDSGSSEVDRVTVSVRTLASQFENTGAVEGGVVNSGSRPCSRHSSLKSDSKDLAQGPVTVQRTRSKSESFSRKPKSLLKSKKNKSRPRKSVTFADSIAHYGNSDEAGYESARELCSSRVKMDDRAYYSDNEERLAGSCVSYSDNDLDDMEDTGSSNSDEPPVAEEDACQLCHKRRNNPGKVFCAKCSYYMSKLKST